MNTDRKPGSPHFLSVSSWTEAERHLSFGPRVPTRTLGRELESLAIFVRDHRHREVPLRERSLEAHYGLFVYTQSRPGKDEARRRALAVKYGLFPREAAIGPHAARTYALGPEVEPGALDGRVPAVVTWHEDGMHFLVASTERDFLDLMEVAGSLYG